MMCGNCDKTDGLVYTTNPPQVRCRLSGNFHFMNDKCDAIADDEWQEPEINPCRGCDDYDNQGGCQSNGGCGAKMDEVEDE